MLRGLGHEAAEVRKPEQLAGLDGLIIPGGESTTIGKLAVEYKLMDPLRAFAAERPIWGTCAGAIFLAGDASAHRPLLHEAADEGRIAGANAAAYPAVRAHVRRAPLMVAFTDPNIAMVGTPLGQLVRDEIEIGAIDYDDQGRARVMGRNAGLVRIYARRECSTLLGAEMFGPRVEHTAHLLAWAVQAHLTVEQALEMPVYHPVVEEGIRTALRDLSARLKLRGAPLAHGMECGPGA